MSNLQHKMSSHDEPRDEAQRLIWTGGGVREGGGGAT